MRAGPRGSRDVATTIVIIILITDMCAGSRSYQKTLLIFNPESETNLKDFIELERIDSSSSDKIPTRPKKFSSQDLNYVNPDYLYDKWMQDPPTEMTISARTFEAGAKNYEFVAQSMYSQAFNSVGATPATWFDAGRAKKNIWESDIDFIMWKESDLVMFGVKGRTNSKYWIIVSPRVDEQGTLKNVVLISKSRGPSTYNVFGGDATLPTPSFWETIQKTTVIKKFTVFGILKVQLNNLPCIRSINIDSVLMADTIADIYMFISEDSPDVLWQVTLDFDATVYSQSLSVNFESVVCPRNMTLHVYNAFDGKDASANITFLEVEGAFNIASFIKIKGLYDPSATEPPPSDPLTTGPPPSDPSTTEPPPSDPLTTGPPPSDPLTTGPPPSDPSTTEPPPSDPLTTGPPPSDPLTTGPPPSDPSTTEPPPSDPLTTGPPPSDPSTTGPPSSDPSTTRYSSLEPSTTGPPLLDPSTTGPPSSDPSTTGPPPSEPSTTGPPPSDPLTTGPPPSDPSTTGPPSSDPSTTRHSSLEPSTTGPPLLDPSTTGPPSSDPSTTGPPPSEPSTTGPPSSDPSITRPSSLEPSTTRSPPADPSTRPSSLEPSTTVRSPADLSTRSPPTDPSTTSDQTTSNHLSNQHTSEIPSQGTTVTTSVPTEELETIKPLQCYYNKFNDWNKSLNSSELQALLAEIARLKKLLAVNKTTLASTIRRKTSAPDMRLSSKIIGYVGGVVLAIVFGGLIIIDLPTIGRSLKLMKRNLLEK